TRRARRPDDPVAGSPTPRLGGANARSLTGRAIRASCGPRFSRSSLVGVTGVGGAEGLQASGRDRQQGRQWPGSHLSIAEAGRSSAYGRQRLRLTGGLMAREAFSPPPVPCAKPLMLNMI